MMTLNFDTVPAALCSSHANRGLRQSNPADEMPASVRADLCTYGTAHPDWDGVICVVKAERAYWCQISAQEVVSFQSSVTPKLIALLGLRGSSDDGAISDCLSRPERLGAYLSRADLYANDALALGALLGAELAATRPYWLGQEVVILGGGETAMRYHEGLSAQGVLARLEVQE